MPILTETNDLSGFSRVLGYGQGGEGVRARVREVKRCEEMKGVIFIFYHWWVPGTTRPRRLLTLWLLPEYQRVIGFSFQLAIIQHQFALHALGYCHLCKDNKGASRSRTYFAILGLALIGSVAGRVRARWLTRPWMEPLFCYILLLFSLLMVCPRGLQTHINRIVRPVHGNL